MHLDMKKLSLSLRMVCLQDGRRNGEGSSYSHDRHGYERPQYYDTRPMYNDRFPYGRGGPSSEEDDRAIALALQEEEQHRECHWNLFLHGDWLCIVSISSGHFFSSTYENHSQGSVGS